MKKIFFKSNIRLLQYGIKNLNEDGDFSTSELTDNILNIKMNLDKQVVNYLKFKWFYWLLICDLFIAMIFYMASDDNFLLLILSFVFLSISSNYLLHIFMKRKYKKNKGKIINKILSYKL